MAENDFQYGGWNYYTLQCGMWLWNHDSEFTKWLHGAPCNVTHSSGIMTLNSPCGSTLQCDRWLWDDVQ